MINLSSILIYFGFLVQAATVHMPQHSAGISGIIIEIILMLMGFVFSAVFSGSEVAFFSISNKRDHLEEMAAKNSVDKILVRMLERPRRLLATILIGNTFANIVSSVLAAVLTGYLAASIGLSELVVFAIEVVALTFTLLILSEITPKIIAINNPLQVARSLCRFIYVFFIVLKPLSKLIADSTELLEKWMPNPRHEMTSEDIKTMAEVGEQEGSLHSDEREIIENVIEFGTTTVREIMTSRTDIVAISEDQTLDEVLTIIREKGLSRMPLYEEDLDTILGIIHSKDVLPFIHSDTKKTTINWRTIARKALFIPASKKLDDLLREFQQEKTHIAVVVDEYGGTEGIVTMDDILEEIIGDISDNNTEGEEELYRQLRDGSYIFDAKIDLDDMEEILDCEITTPDDDFETLGGLVYHLKERIPGVGERIFFKKLELTIHSVQNNRVRKLRVKVNKDKVASPKPESKNK